MGNGYSLPELCRQHAELFREREAIMDYASGKHYTYGDFGPEI